MKLSRRPDPRCPRSVLVWRYLEAIFLVAALAAAVFSLPFVPGDLASSLRLTLAYTVALTWAGALFVQPLPVLSLPRFRPTWPGEPTAVPAIVALVAAQVGWPPEVLVISYALGYVYLRTIGRWQLRLWFGCSP